MKNIITVLAFYICLITNVVAQDCSLSANVISFENSEKEVLAVYFKNQTIVGINTTTPSGQNAALLILDSLETILSIIPSNPSDCSLYYRVEDQLFVDTSTHDFYQIAEISWDNLETNLSTGQNTNDLNGCFVLSNQLRVIDWRLNSLTEIATLPDSINEEYLNVFGGGTVINGTLNLNAQTSISICNIDSLNRSFGLLGAVGPQEKWVITSRSGVIIELLDLPLFDFQSYFEEVEISSTLHELELFYIAYSGRDDWLVKGANIKTDLCNVPTSNRSTLYEINWIECEDTCNDNYLNGTEVERDSCVIDSLVTCIISDIQTIDCFGELTGSATVAVTGGIGPFRFLWETGDTTLSIDSVGAGIYDVTVLDGIGLKTECTANITQSDSLSVEIVVNAVGNCSAMASVDGGLAPYQYEWSTGESFISISSIDSTHSVTITDVLGCTATATISQDQLSMACGNCGDGIMNGDETGIDCGGLCEPCIVTMDSLNLNALQVVKRAQFVDENNNGFMEEGETINYLFSVCNAGSVGLTQVYIDDPLISVIGDTISLDSMSCNATAFTGSYTLTADDVVAGLVTNQATASAMLHDTIMISDLSDDSDVMTDIDSEDDGEPDDPTVLTLNVVGPCGIAFIDTDMDGTCDAEDADDDNDNVLDIDDAFPLNASESVDSDGDGFGNNGDFDDDNDGVDDRSDAFPLDPTESLDTDDDGIGDNSDMNDDGDACDDLFDNNPLVFSESCMIVTGCDSLVVSDSTVLFSGSIVTDIGFNLDSVEIAIAATGVRDTSFTTDGDYTSSSLPKELDFIIRPSKEDSPFLGVTTLDMLFIQRHILRLDRLPNPYKIIAADVSGNAGISIVDIIIMRRMILGIVDQWNEGVSWKFVDAEFEFFDPFVPWPFRSAKEISNADISRCNIDFIAIKLGDVDNSYEGNNVNQTEVRTNNNIYQLKYNTQQLENGQFKHSFYMPEDDLLFGLQFGLQGLTNEHVVVKSAGIEINDTDVLIQDEELKLSWTNPHGLEVNAGQVLFTIESKSDIDIILKTVNISPEIYIEETIETYNLQLVEENTAIVIQPTFNPNPFDYSTTLTFSLTERQTIKVSVFDASGAIHWTLSNKLSAGHHEISIPAESLAQTGLYFYTIESNGKSYSGKLVKSD